VLDVSTEEVDYVRDVMVLLVEVTKPVLPAPDDETTPLRDSFDAVYAGASR